MGVFSRNIFNTLLRCSILQIVLRCLPIGAQILGSQFDKPSTGLIALADFFGDLTEG